MLRKVSHSLDTKFFEKGLTYAILQLYQKIIISSASKDKFFSIFKILTANRFFTNEEKI